MSLTHIKGLCFNVFGAKLKLISRNMAYNIWKYIPTSISDVYNEMTGYGILTRQMQQVSIDTKRSQPIRRYLFSDYFSVDRLPNTVSVSVGPFDSTFMSDLICQLLLQTGASSSRWGHHPHISRDRSDNWEKACGAVAGRFVKIKGEPLLCCSTSVPDPEERVWLPSHL